MPKVGEQIAKGEKRLTPPQQKFLDNYIHKDMTQTAAARAAGYKNPNVSAVQLLNHPRVKERMEEMRQELESKVTGLMVARSHVTHEHVDNLSREQIVEQLQEFMDRAKNRMIDVTPTENPTKSEQIPITDCSGEAAE